VPGPALVAPPAPERADPELVEKAGVRGAGQPHPAASAAGLRVHAPAPAAPPGGPGPELVAEQSFKCIFNKSIVFVIRLLCFRNVVSIITFFGER
jgi:hypothetical protein